MDDKTPKGLSQKEKDTLDRQMARLEPKIVDAKHKYEELVSQYAALLEKRHPEKREERIKEELFRAYQNSNRSLDQILSFMASEHRDEW